jgi:hypothetical protein
MIRNLLTTVSSCFLSSLSLINYVKSKGKAISLEAWTVPEGSRRLRLPDFKTIDT